MRLSRVGVSFTRWVNLNGLWEWEEALEEEEEEISPPWGRKLNGSIMVPFPVESCLSGVAPSSTAALASRMWYRLVFDYAMGDSPHILHFGAVDWQATVYLNGVRLGETHTGGYEAFSFHLDAGSLKPAGNELFVYVYDPSDSGAQPQGKQRASAISEPGGDTYSPSSGIWQTVWLERVPNGTHLDEDLKIEAVDLASVRVTVKASDGAEHNVTFEVYDAAGLVLRVPGRTGLPVRLEVDAATRRRPWSPEDPFLYDLRIECGEDRLLSYFGLRTFGVGADAAGMTRPLLNGAFHGLVGVLDQSFWPDGLYTAPTDEALAFDIAVVRELGMNLIRLHQKINPERWYYHADRLGVILFQDLVQKYGGATAETVPLFLADLRALIAGPRTNHPSVVQWTAFNEGDCWKVFQIKPWDVAGVVNLIHSLDLWRPIDVDSGGKANDLGLGDVNDVHDYPEPGDPNPSATQYAMVGEFGGLGLFTPGREWKPGGCFAYRKVTNLTSAYVAYAEEILSKQETLSAAVYTQTTDVETECDGFLNYDRTHKLSGAEISAVRDANRRITGVIPAGTTAAGE